MKDLIHLNCHSEYSIIDGILRLKPLLQQIQNFNMSAVALTDHNLFALIKFYKLAINLGIKPILGCDVWLAGKIGIDKESNQVSRLTLLCQNEVGLRNLIQLTSRSYTNWQKSKPIVDPAWLLEDALHLGLIAIAPMADSDISYALHQDLAIAKKLLNNWLKVFGDRFYLAISRIGQPREENVLEEILNLAQDQIPIVASGEVRFLLPEDFRAHEARICINQGVKLDDPKRIRNYTPAQYLKNSAEMSELFKDLPAAIINTQELAKRCNVHLALGKTYLPRFNTPAAKSEQEYLVELAEQGLKQRLHCANYAAIPKNYVERLATELQVINSMGFAGYFLIVADLIQWALRHKIPVGPGRGSGAGSLVAYVLFITNIDPLSYGLLFERFLNPERVSMPDFDIDFCMHGRDRVLEYAAYKYGKASVAQIITYGTMAAKAAVRDLGRVLGSPYGFVDQIAKLIPLELGMTISKALNQEITLKTKYEEDDEVRSIIDLALKLEGITRNVGKHAGGLVIAPQPIINFSPLYYEENTTSPVTQFDKNDIEDVGLVKFDFLGLKTLTVIDLAVRSINKYLAQLNQPLIDLQKICVNDQKTLQNLSAGNTVAIFQLESRGMQELTVRLKPSSFEDLIAIGALYRPGPLQAGMVDQFIDRKRGKIAIEYPHPELESILKPTYGVIVYQEQVMQIAQVLAGYTLGAADLLRRAMGKKKPEEMAKQRKIFIAGVINLDQQRPTALQVGKENADQIFDLMDKFAGYGFNKSHAAAYALITLQTAWLKTYYPAAFMAAVLSLELANTDKLIMLIGECRKMKIKIASPNINTGDYYFVMQNVATLSYGLGAIKGVGENAVNSILAARAERKFEDLLDLCRRVDLHKVSKKTLEALIKAGALDCFKLHRAALLSYLDLTIKMASKVQQHASKQLDLFADHSLAEFNKANALQFVATICPAWAKEELLAAEKQALGFYFSDHPLLAFAKDLLQQGVIKFTQATCSKNLQKFAGCIVGIRVTKTKKGDQIAFVTLDDAFTRQEIVVFADLYLQYKELLKKDQLIMLEGEVSKDHYTNGFKIKCSKIIDLRKICKKIINDLNIVLDPKILDLQVFTQKIKEILKAFPGTCPLYVHYKNNNSGLATKIRLGNEWLVDPRQELYTKLRDLPDIIEVY